MNKVFKVVWSEATGTWVAVSEAVKAHGKTKSKSSKITKVTGAVVLGLGALLSIQSAYAATVDGAVTGSTTGTGNIVIGANGNTVASQIGTGGSGYNTVLGTNAKLQKAGGTVGNGIDSAVAIGANATAGNKAIAIGGTWGSETPTQAQGDKSIAMGYQANAVQVGDIALGTYANITYNGAGNAAGTRTKNESLNGVLPSVAIGFKATSNGELGDTIVGAHASNNFGQTISNAGGVTTIGQSTAIGSRAFVYGDQATALGADTSAIGHSSIAIGGDDIDRAKVALQAAIPEITDRAINLGSLESVRAQLAKHGASQAAQNLVNSETAFDNLNNTTDTNYRSNSLRTSAGGDASIAIGPAAQTAGTGSVALGTNAIALDTASIAQGVFSRARSLNSVAIGSVSSAEGNSSIAFGHNAVVNNANNGTAIGHNALVVANAVNSLAVGTEAETRGTSAIAVGHNTLAGGYSKAHSANATTALDAIIAAVDSGIADQGMNAIQNKATAAANTGKTNATADVTETVDFDAIVAQIGALRASNSSGGYAAYGAALKSYLTNFKNNGVVYNGTGNSSVAVGHQASAFTNHSIAIGTNAAAGYNSSATTNTDAINAIAIGTNANASGNSSIAVGVGNVVSGNNSGAFGDPSYVTGNGSYSIGNNNTITTNNTFVLGSGINRNTDLTTNGSGTVENSVYLGNESEVTAGSAVGTKTLNSNQSTGTATTAGATGTVNDATVNGISYSGFQGATSNGAVSVGASGTERRIQNVAAGEISATSTDAINGSQLYMTQNALGNLAKSTANHLGGGSAVNTDGTLTAPTYNVYTGTATPNATGNSQTVFGSPATNVGQAITNLNTYINQGFNVKDNAGTTQGVVTPGESIQFVNGGNTTAKVITEANGTTKVTFDVVLPTGGANIVTGKPTYNGTTGRFSNDNVEAPKLVNVSTLTEGLNNTGFFLSGEANDGKFDDTAAADKKIVNGDTFLLKAGAGTNITQIDNGYKISVDPVNITAGNSNVTITGNSTSGYTISANDTNTQASVNSTDKSVTVAPTDNANGTKNYDLSVNVDGTSIVKNTNGVLSVANTTLTPNTAVGNISTPTEGDKLVNATTVANAINQSGFKVAQGNDVKDVVNPGDTVSYVNGSGTIANVSSNGTTTTVKYDANVGAGLQIKDGQIVANGTNITAGNDNVTVTGDAINGYTISAKDTNTQASVISSDKSVSITNTSTNTNGTTIYDVAVNVDGTSITKDPNNGTLSVATTNLTPNANGSINAPSTDDGNKLVNATTVANAINNSGWKLGDNTGTNPALIKPSNQVNFVNGNGTTSKVVTDAQGVTNVSFDVANTTLPVTVGSPVTVPTGDDAKKFVNAGDLANTLNNLSFNVIANQTGTGTVSGNASTAVKTGDTVAFIAGDNVDIKQEGQNFTISTKATPINTTALTPNANGSIDAPNTTDGDKLVNATTVAGAINKSGVVVQANGQNVSNVSGGGDSILNPGEALNFINGTGTVANVTDKGVTFDVKADNATIKVDPTTGNITAVTTTATAPTTGTNAGKVAPADGTGANLMNATAVSDAINSAFWTAKRGDSVDTNADTNSGDSQVNAGDSVTFVAGKNLALQKDGDKFIYATKDNVTFTDVTTNNFTVPTNTASSPITITADGISAGNKPITNVLSNLTTYTDAPKAGLVNLTNATPTNAATVGDLQKMGWVVQSDKTTSGSGEFTSQVKNADQVKFVGTGAANVSGKTENGVNTITVHVDPTQAISTTNLTVADGKVTDPNATTAGDGDKLVNATTVANAINSAGVLVQANGQNVSNVSGGGDSILNPGEALNFINGTGTVANVTDKGVTFDVKADNATIKVDPTTGNITAVTTTATAPTTGTNAGKVAPADGTGANLMNATAVSDAINSAFWTAKRGDSVDTNADTNSGDSQVNAGDSVTFVAGKNLALQKDGDKFIYATKDNVTFTDVTTNNFTVPTNPANPSSSPITITADGISAGNKPITNVLSNLTTYTDAPKAGLVNLTNATPTNAATVGDLQNMGWVVSAIDDTNKPYSDQVKNANEVKFVGQNGTTVTGETKDGVRTITIEAVQKVIGSNTVEGTTNINVNAENITDSSGQTVVDSSGNPVKKFTISADTTDLTPNATGTIDNPTKPNALVNASTVANAINKAGFKVADGTGVKSDLVNAGDTVTFANGSNTVANVTTTADGITVKYDVATTTFTAGGAANGGNAGTMVAPNATEGAKFLNATEVAKAVNNTGFSLTTSAVTGSTGESEAKVSGADTFIKAGETLNLDAGNNIAIKQIKDGFAIATKDNVTFNNVNTTTLSVGDTTTANADKPVVNFTTAKATPATNNQDGKAPTAALNITSADDKPTQLTGVGSVLNTTMVATNPDANTSTAPINSTLVNLGNASNPLPDSVLNSAATVRDIANMGWVVSAQDGYSDTVKNANEVKFTGTGLATVTGETKDGIRTITVDVNAQRTVETAQTPVVYTNAAGDKLVKVGDQFYKAGDVTNGMPNTGATPVPAGDVIASMNNGANNTTTPMTLTNINSTLPATYSSTTNPITGAAVEPTKEQKAPSLTASQYNNAATVGDVLNAGWNLQENGTAKDFIKAYDTVNFVNGQGTTANVTVRENGSIADVTYNVAVDNTTTKLTYVDAQGKPVTKNAAGDYVDAQGKPLSAADAANVTSQVTANLPVVKAGAGTSVSSATVDGVTTYTVSATGVDVPTTNLTSNPNGTVTAPNGNETNLVNAGDIAKAINNSGFSLAANGSNASLVNPGESVDLKNTDGNIVIAKSDKDNNVTFNLNNTVKIGDNSTNVNNKPITINGDTGVISGLNGSLPATYNVDAYNTANKPVTTSQDLPKGLNTTNAATVGDILNAGWNLQNNGTAKDFVKAYDTVNFVNGVGTTADVKVNANGTVADVAYNVAVDNTTTAITYVDNKGNTVYPITDAQGNVTYNTKADGKGTPVDAKDVTSQVTAKLPTVSNGTNIEVVEGKNADGSKNYTVKTADNVTFTNVNATNITAGNSSSPITIGTDKAGNNVIGNLTGNLGNVSTWTSNPQTNVSAPANRGNIINNAATVGDVLNAGWNLQANGNAVDFVNPYDTVNFVGKDGTDISATSVNGTSTITIGAVKTIQGNSVTGGDNVNIDVTDNSDGSKNFKVNVNTGSLTPNANGTVSNSGTGLATTADVANAINKAGFKVAQNGNTLPDLINAGDTVNYVNGTGTVANVTANTDGSGANVTYNVAVDNTTTEITYVTKAGDTVYAIKDPTTGNITGYNTKADGTGSPVNAGDIVNSQVSAKLPTVSNGTNIEVVEGKNADGSKNYTVKTADNVTFTNVNATNITAGNSSSPITIGTDKAGNNVIGNLTGNLPNTYNTDVYNTANNPVTTSQVLPANLSTRNAATVGDILNAGWNLQANGKAVDFVKPYDTVNFVNGSGTKVIATANAQGTASDVKIDVDYSNLVFNVNGTNITAVGNATTGYVVTLPNAGNNSNANITDGNKLIGANSTNSNSSVVDAKGNELTDKDGKPITIEDPLITYDAYSNGTVRDNSIVSAINNINEQGTKYIHVNGGESSAGGDRTKPNDVQSQANGDKSVAIGHKIVTNGTGSVAIGSGYILSAEEQTRLTNAGVKLEDIVDTNGTTVLGQGLYTKTKGNQSVAIGSGSQAIGEQTIAIGSGNVVTGNHSGAIGDPTVVTGNSSYSIGNNNIISTNNTYALGSNITATAENSVALGDNTTITNGNGTVTATLNNLKTDGTNGTTTTAGTIGTVATATVGGVTYGGFAGATADGAVSVGAAGTERRIQNVAAGEISATSTDAINGSQLYAVAGAVSNVAVNVNNLNNRVNDIEENAYAGVAQSIATAGLPQAYLPGKSLVAVGTGYYKGETGYAVSFSSISDGGNWIFKGTGSGSSQGNVGGSVAIGYQW